MSWREFIPGRLRRPLRRWRARWRSEAPAPPPGRDAWFSPDQIEVLRRTYYDLGSAEGGPWDRYRDAHLVLPDWFRHGLDPWGEEYAAQQQRLWALIAGVDRPYEPDLDEKETGWKGVDPVRTPGFYVRRDAQAIASASDHLLATGMILKHCALRAGDWALEYGAGFGQTALALARLGVNVDTVDISAKFCEFVQAQAEHFSVPLNAFQGRFGMNPRPGQRYKLIWFYESFHHCVDFQQVVPKLADHLAEGGRVILGGEPIFERTYAGIPYPWGVRLHSEVAAVMRQTQWFELGFTEAFLYELFQRSGFVGRKVDCEPSLFGRLYTFERQASASAPTTARPAA